MIMIKCIHARTLLANNASRVGSIALDEACNTELLSLVSQMIIGHEWKKNSNKNQKMINCSLNILFSHSSGGLAVRPSVSVV